MNILDKVKSLPLPGFRHLRGSWQHLKKNSVLKASLIEPVLQETKSSNFLDIGCNAGEVTRLLSTSRFAVGIDINVDFRGFDDPLHNVALGQIKADISTLKKSPPFDAVLLLSVHHQWYSQLPQEEADKLFVEVLNISKKVLIVEFAAIKRKYGFTGEEFIDNDISSVKDYALDFLKTKLEGKYAKISYLGTVPELVRIEPERLMFAVYRSTSD